MLQFVLIGFLLPGGVTEGDTSSGWSRDMPVALRNAFNYRTMPRTGYAKIHSSTCRGSAKPTQATLEQRFAGRSFKTRHDYEGAGAAFHTVVTDDSMEYRRQEGTDLASGNKANPAADINVRSMGLLWGLQSSQDPLALVNQATADGHRRFRSRDLDNGHILVEAKYRSEESDSTDDIAWTIDPKRDYSIVQIDYSRHSEKQKEHDICTTRVETAFTDGFWWPKRVWVECDSTGLKQEIEVLELEFNRASHPQKIGLDQLGLPVGGMIRVSEYDPEQPDAPSVKTLQYIGNNNFVPVGDEERINVKASRMRIEADLKATTQPVGSRRIVIVPNAQDAENGQMGPSRGPVSGNPNEWETFVCNWIARYSGEGRLKVKVPLDEKQKSAALAILEDCRKQARPLVARRRSELVAAQREVGEMQSALQSQSTATSEVLSKLTEDRNAAMERLDKLGQPIPEVEDIFANLKERLGGLLTVQQRNP